MSFSRFTPLLRQRLFTTSTQSRNAIAIGDVATEELAAASKAVPKLGRIARWYLPSMAVAAVGMMYIPASYYIPQAEPKPRSVTLDAACRHIGYSITTALNESNRAIHVPVELTQEQKNQQLMDLYGERSSLEDMERAIAGMEARVTSQKDRNAALEAAYGDRSSIKDLERAMEIYEVHHQLDAEGAKKLVPTKGKGTTMEKEQYPPDAASHTARAREDRSCNHQDAHYQPLEK